MIGFWARIVTAVCVAGTAQAECIPGLACPNEMLAVSAETTSTLLKGICSVETAVNKGEPAPGGVACSEISLSLVNVPDYRRPIELIFKGQVRPRPRPLTLKSFHATMVLPGQFTSKENDEILLNDPETILFREIEATDSDDADVREGGLILLRRTSTGQVRPLSIVAGHRIGDCVKVPFDNRDGLLCSYADDGFVRGTYESGYMFIGFFPNRSPVVTKLFSIADANVVSYADVCTKGVALIGYRGLVTKDQPTGAAQGPSSFTVLMNYHHLPPSRRHCDAKGKRLAEVDLVTSDRSEIEAVPAKLARVRITISADGHQAEFATTDDFRPIFRTFAKPAQQRSR